MKMAFTLNFSLLTDFEDERENWCLSSKMSSRFVAVLSSYIWFLYSAEDSGPSIKYVGPLRFSKVEGEAVISAT